MTTAWNAELPVLTSEAPCGLRVLLVEDCNDYATSTAWLLRKYGHEVKVASDGPAALLAVETGMPDVVFLDIGLPGHADGYEVAQRLQEYNAEKKPLVVAITGYGSDADRRHSSEAGIDLHLVKPVQINDLLRLLNRFQRIIER